MRGTTGTVRAPQTLHDAKELRRDIVEAWRRALPARRVKRQPEKGATAVAQ